MEDVIEGKDFNFPQEEENILEYWQKLDAFGEQLRRSEGKPEYIFYDGPPFATGLPHYGHILAGTIKDIVTRYAVASGHHVIRRFGWDCHGLPVEYEIDKAFDIKTRDDVLKMGIANYNEECRKIVMRYSKVWEKTVVRLGRWIDFENDYKTLDRSFMESVWWVFKQLYDKGLVYQGSKVMAYSIGCSTPLSNFEASLNYIDVQDPSVKVTFPIIDDKDNAMFVAWTTTPWTLPSNVALCVNADFDYVKIKDPASGAVYLVAECQISEVPGAVVKKSKNKNSENKGFEIIQKMKGAELVGLRYEPLFSYFKDLRDKGAFRVISDNYVTAGSGTGVVHQAPAFGEDDHRVCLREEIIVKGGDLPCPVDDSGRFTEIVTDFKGMNVKEADKYIIKHLKEIGRLLEASTVQHSYPFCWRSDTPLIYKAVPSWFVKVESIKEQMLENNKKTYWVPNNVKEGRFHSWLENARDWAISRSRFWGTPLPIWISEDKKEIVVIGSLEELENLTGSKVTDLHRHFIDDLTIPSKEGRGVLRRVDEVFDCWFESGSMPYAQLHYPFENRELFETNFPADFIAEGLDQTRGWFYTLTVLATALFDKPAFKNNVVNGMVLAEDGKKMSKRLKNYPDPVDVINSYGADALRLYLINSPVVRAESLRFAQAGVKNVVKVVFLPWYNAYRFLVQNTLRWETASQNKFTPKKVDLSKVTNVFDKWINAAARSLIIFFKEEMDAYRLYTVVPYLVKFIDNLTNIYVRYNRKRLKGRGSGEDDCSNALASLFDVLLTVCKVMAPFTPFLTEKMYVNLRRCIPEGTLPESVHFCEFPKIEMLRGGDERIQESVGRMQRVVELARKIRAQKNVAIKMPVKKITVVHPSTEFITDITGDLATYVKEELNVSELEVCQDILKYCLLKADPDWRALGSRLKQNKNKVSEAIKALTVQELLDLEKNGVITLEGFEITSDEVKREFKLPDGADPEKICANGDNDVLVILDLSVDDNLLKQGLAREIVNRYQKLRKKVGLTINDTVEFYYEFPKSAVSPDETIVKVFRSHREYFIETLGALVIPIDTKPLGAVMLGKETHAIREEANLTFSAIIATPAVSLITANIKKMGADEVDCEDLAVYFASRNREILKSELESNGGTIKFNLNGKDWCLSEKVHFFISATEAYNFLYQIEPSP